MRKSVQGLVFAALTSLVLAGRGAAVQAAPASSPDTAAAFAGGGFGQRYFHTWLQVPGFDGTPLGANLYVPWDVLFPGKRPTIIMPSSWGIDEGEYDQKAREFANDGYVVLGYAPRGFGSSGGMVDVAGPNSQRDNQAVVDWLIANTSADPERIGMAGISYGAGLGLLAAGQDPRIKAVVALSGWADLRHSLYNNETVREFWLNLIIATGAISGNLDPDVYNQVGHLKTQTAVDEVMAWGAARSAVTLIDQINARKVPIFIANSYEDNLFPPAQGRDFFSHLTGPKKYYLDHGIHGTSSLPGLIGLPSDVWIEGKRWLDHYLAGKDTGIAKEPPVTFQTATGKTFFPDFPPLGEAQATFSLQPLNTLSTSTDKSKGEHEVVGFLAGIDSGATSGIPILSDAGSGVLQLPIQTMFAVIDQRFAAVYKTKKVTQPTKLRGSSKVRVPLEPHNGPMLLVAYLYDVDDWGLATLVSYGVASRHTAATDVTHLEIDLGVTAYDVPAGDHLVVAMDSIDPLYQAPYVFPYRLEIAHHQTDKVTLDLPVVL